MFSRILGIPILVGAAATAPYLASNAPKLDEFWQPKVHAPTEDAPPVLSDELLAAAPRERWDPPPRGPGDEIFPLETPLEGLPRTSVYEVFRFDVTKEWVYHRWARKSTALSELGLYGIRVPLVTGTELFDVAGSLTYFFDQQGAVQRITFRGNTGDTTQLVMLATQQYGLQPQATPIVGEQLFQVRNQNDVFSELRTRPSAVLWSSSPHNSFSVELELQRPGATTPLPARIPELPEIPEEVVQEQEELSQAEKEKRSRERFDNFFPRSRTPAKQIENLDRRNRAW